MKELFRQLHETLKNGEDAALVTVAASSGSTPRGAGAHMLVGKKGIICGTVGGGALEHRAAATAADALDEGRSYVKSYALRPGEAEDLGMICGGGVEVFFQYIPPDDLSIAEHIMTCLNKDTDCWLITELTGASAWKAGTYSQIGGLYNIDVPDEILPSVLRANAVQLEHKGYLYYGEPLVRAGKVIVFGGGHVARELVPLLSRVGFRCAVFDDREEFASRDRFPDADRVILGDFSRIRDFLEISGQDYVVIMTRGHAWDFIVEEQALRGEAAYVGVIGSRNKVAVTRQKLLDAGIPKDKLDRVHSPIGLPIHAETPAEIAVSIAAEMIQTRALLTKAEA